MSIVILIQITTLTRQLTLHISKLDQRVVIDDLDCMERRKTEASRYFILSLKF